MIRDSAAACDKDKFTSRVFHGTRASELRESGRFHGSPLKFLGSRKLLQDGFALFIVEYCESTSALLVKGDTIVSSAFETHKPFSLDCKKDGKPDPLLFGALIPSNAPEPEWVFRVDLKKGVIARELGSRVPGVQCELPPGYTEPEAVFQFSDEQRPELDIPENPPPDYCAIADARPALDKSSHEARKYKLETLNRNPLVLRESLSLLGGSTMSLEQRGCSDIYHKFTFTFAKPADPQARISEALESLSALHYTKDALFDRKNVKLLHRGVDAYLKQLEEEIPEFFVICTSYIEFEPGRGECLTDTSFEFDEDTLIIKEVNRP